MRRQLDVLARRFDEQPADVELREGLVLAPPGSGPGLTPDPRRILTAIDGLPARLVGVGLGTVGGNPSDGRQTGGAKAARGDPRLASQPVGRMPGRPGAAGPGPGAPAASAPGRGPARRPAPTILTPGRQPGGHQAVDRRAAPPYGIAGQESFARRSDRPKRRTVAWRASVSSDDRRMIGGRILNPRRSIVAVHTPNLLYSPFVLLVYEPPASDP